MVGAQVGCVDLCAVAELIATNIDNRGGVGVAVDRQGDGIAQLDVFAHGAAHKGLGFCIFSNVDHVVASDDADGDVRMGRACVKVDSAAGRGGAGVAGGVIGHDLGIDAVVGPQIRGVDLGAVAKGAARVHNCCGVGMAVDRQGDGVARLDVAAHCAAHRGLALVVFCNVQHVVASDDADGDGRSGGRGVKADIAAGRGRSGVASGVIGHDLGINALIGPQIGGVNLGAVAELVAANIDNRGVVGMAVDRQGNGVTQLYIGTHRAAHRGLGLGIF